MRTTVTLDADVEAMLRRAVRERNESFKQVLNAAIREGLRPQHARSVKPFRQVTFDMGAPLPDLTKALALSAQLEDNDTLAKSSARRKPK